MSQPPHSWKELDWCLQYPKLTQVNLSEADVKGAQFEKSKIGRMDGTGCYEYAADLKVYRVHNVLRFGDNNPRYFSVFVRVADAIQFVAKRDKEKKEEEEEEEPARPRQKPQHTWDELNLCIQNALKTRFDPTEAEMKQFQFEKCKEGRKNGIGFYEFCPKTRTYRCSNIFSDDTSELYFRPAALAADN